MWLFVVVVALGLLVLWAWRLGTMRRAVSDLPARERAAVFPRELESFRALCGRGPRHDALEPQCRARAEFILAFPECDAACQALAKSHVAIGARR